MKTVKSVSSAIDPIHCISMAPPTPSVAAGVLFRFLKEKMGSRLLAIGYFAICWLLLWLLYRKKVFLKV